MTRACTIWVSNFSEKSYVVRYKTPTKSFVSACTHGIYIHASDPGHADESKSCRPGMSKSVVRDTSRRVRTSRARHVATCHACALRELDRFVFLTNPLREHTDCVGTTSSTFKQDGTSWGESFEKLEMSACALLRPAPTERRSLDRLTCEALVFVRSSSQDDTRSLE